MRLGDPILKHFRVLLMYDKLGGIDTPPLFLQFHKDRLIGSSVLKDHFSLPASLQLVSALNI